jgi:hypothetical protein
MAAKPISALDLLTPDAYEKVRGARIADIIKVKDARRVEVGPWVSCVFENRATVLHQIQEMVRIERLTDPAAVAHEIETFADLVPAEGELSLTLFIEITDAVMRQKALASLGGIEKTLHLVIGNEKIPAFDKRPIDPAWERPGQATAVYYLGFKVPQASRSRFESEEASLSFGHPRYRHSAGLSSEQRAELAGDWR